MLPDLSITNATLAAFEDSEEFCSTFTYSVFVPEKTPLVVAAVIITFPVLVLPDVFGLAVIVKLLGVLPLCDETVNQEEAEDSTCLE